MIPNARALERIESAERENPVCVCGRHTVATARNGAIWLECASLAEARGMLERVMSLDLAIGHTRQLIIDALDLAPAA